MKYKITEVIASLYAQNYYLLDGTLLNENEKEYYRNVKTGMEDTVATGAVHSMANFNSTFKTNPYLCRGLITGITRISKESIFSDLNNLKVITTTSSQYATAFGFTEEEVFKALDDTGLGDEKQGVKAWYNGFTFGAYSDIYNPWSIASFIDNRGHKGAANGSSLRPCANLQGEEDASPFYHGFVLGLMVELDGRFEITSNRESGFGRYDIMRIPKDRERDCAYITEFKVHKPLKEKDLAQTVANALNQIEEKRYGAQLAADGFAPERIRKYGFAFQGKECMIGC